MSDDPFLRMEDIVKEFPGVVANDHVDFSVRRGEIHGLLGENGAGKSTLMNVLYGLYRPDGGAVYLAGERLDLDSPQDAIRNGIGMVHQHFMLIPRLTVAENVVLGRREPAASFRDDADRRWPDWLATNPVATALGRLFTLGLDQPRERIADLADQYGFQVDVDARIWELDVGQQQRIEILKALYRDVDLLILDEPTAVLTPNEAERLFETLEQLAQNGLTIIFITHKLKEVTALTDRVTVLRDGEKVDTVETASVTREDLARLMVGREVLFELEKDDVESGAPVMAAEGLYATDDRGIEALAGVDLEIHEGEIVGIAGVSGNGQRELAEALVGLRQPSAGTITVGDTDLTGASARAFIENGVSFVPEDRYRFGCAEELSVMHNAVMKDYRRSEFGDRLLDYDAMRAYAEELVESFDIRGVSDVAEMRAGDLSGGNLQKLILARELSRDPDVLIANQPTRGVDVGAIEFVRKTILEQRGEGTGVLLISEDLDELFELSDRILVIYEGEFVHDSTPEETSPEEVGLEMTGGRGLESEPSGGAAVAEPAEGDAP
jgi:simple sugar transport system ATP-binding protein